MQGDFFLCRFNAGLVSPGNGYKLATRRYKTITESNPPPQLTRSESYGAKFCQAELPSHENT